MYEQVVSRLLRNFFKPRNSPNVKFSGHFRFGGVSHKYVALAVVKSYSFILGRDPRNSYLL